VLGGGATFITVGLSGQGYGIEYSRSSCVSGASCISISLHVITSVLAVNSSSYGGLVIESLVSNVVSFGCFDCRSGKFCDGWHRGIQDARLSISLSMKTSYTTSSSFLGVDFVVSGEVFQCLHVR
jgi:hypothetical protein